MKNLYETSIENKFTTSIKCIFFSIYEFQQHIIVIPKLKKSFLIRMKIVFLSLFGDFLFKQLFEFLNVIFGLSSEERFVNKTLESFLK